jgi:hypothetical protein
VHFEILTELPTPTLLFPTGTTIVRQVRVAVVVEKARHDTTVPGSAKTKQRRPFWDLFGIFLDTSPGFQYWHVWQKVIIGCHYSTNFAGTSQHHSDVSILPLARWLFNVGALLIDRVECFDR